MPQTGAQNTNNSQPSDDFNNSPKASPEPEELFQQGIKIAQALKDLSNNNTDLGKSQNQAKDARTILQEVKSEQELAPALREAILNLIKKAIAEKYSGPAAEKMFNALAGRVNEKGEINNEDLEQLDWQTQAPGAREKLEDVGLTPDQASAPDSEEPFIKPALQEKYQGVKGDSQGLVQNRPDLPTLPKDPEEVDQAPQAQIPEEQGMEEPRKVLPQEPQETRQPAHDQGQAAKLAGQAPVSPLDIQAQLQQARRQDKGIGARKASKNQTQMGSGHWQGAGEQPQDAGAGEAVPPSDGALPSGRVPQASSQAGQGPIAGQSPVLSQAGGKGDGLTKRDLVSARRQDRKKRHHQVMQSLPQAIASGQISDLAQIPGASGMKDEKNQKLDLDQNLTNYTDSDNEDQAIDSAEKELDTIGQKEANEPKEEGKAPDKETASDKKAARKAAKEKYNRNVRKAKLASGLRKIINKHENTNWFSLFAVAAFRDLLSCFEFGFLVIIFGPIQFFCQLYKKIVLAGRETSTDNAVGWVTTTIKSVPILDYIPAAMAEIARIHSASRAKMIKAQKQLDRILEGK